ncbi:MAG: alpha/beta hydrolase [Lachnospiraceae bacterium]|nr:alpha/beta hydrolase [Lachnospiraceae bacterium]
MEYRRFDLSADFRETDPYGEKTEPCLDAYLRRGPFIPAKRKAVLVCPGGAYRFTSLRESEPVALRFFAEGIQAFVLWYSAPAPFPKALTELARSVRFIRANAADWNIDPEGIYVMGFSAGGHLAASLSNMWHMGFLNDLCGSAPDEIRPDGNILCYPVITSGEYAHAESFEHLLTGIARGGRAGARKDPYAGTSGDTHERFLRNLFSEETADADGENRELPDDLLAFNSLEDRVSERTPPTFIWTTWTDRTVPAWNTIRYVEALYRHGVPCDAHIFRKGVHGLSLGTAETAKAPAEAYVEPAAASWVSLCVDWILNRNPRTER